MSFKALVPPADFDTPGPAASGRRQTWQNILWREWRYSEDEAYAQSLFDLVADEPAARVATLMTVLLGLCYGGLGGLLMSLSQAPVGSQIGWPGFIGIGAAVGGMAGLFLGLAPAGQKSWRTWLTRLTFNLAPEELGLLGGGLLFVVLGGLVGWLVSWRAGLGHVVGIILLSILLASGLGGMLISWLIGWGGESNPTYLHRYRAGWFWWRRHPRRAEVAVALQQACLALPTAKEIWLEALQKLTWRQEQLEPLPELIEQLQSEDWLERFTARHILATSGGEAVTYLKPIAAGMTSPLQRTALDLLRRIGQETQTQLAPQASYLMCPRCLARCGAHLMTVSDQEITYYGCRICQQGRELWQGAVIAMLDADMVEEVKQAEGWRINWLVHRALFDFDEVEIVQATDEEVERFAVQVGNDTDPWRQRRYATMPCVIGPACRLSENTLRILKNTFGTIV